VRPTPVVLVALAVASAAGGCGDDGDDDGGGGGARSECPVAATVVGRALDATIEVAAGATPTHCTYEVVVEEPVDDDDPGRAGARVVVDVRTLTAGDYDAALERVERRAGPTEPLGEGDVDGAARGWVSSVGRAVAVGAADALRLATVVVVDPTLDATAARTAAIEIAGAVLG
jgi:hypothetical protein